MSQRFVVLEDSLIICKRFFFVWPNSGKFNSMPIPPKNWMTIKTKPILLMRKHQQRLGPQRLQCLLGSTTASPRTRSSGRCHAICMGLGSLGTPWAFTGPMSWEASHSNVLLATEIELSDMQPLREFSFLYCLFIWQAVDIWRSQLVSWFYFTGSSLSVRKSLSEVFWGNPCSFGGSHPSTWCVWNYFRFSDVDLCVTCVFWL